MNGLRRGTIPLALLALGADLRGQDWSLRPVFTLGVGYDSNIAFTPGQPPGDYFGGVSVRAPLTGKLTRNSSLTANYSASGEWYRERDVFDAFPSEQNATLAWSYAPPEDWNLGLNASYGESRRPEDLFPEAGVGYLRGKAKNLSAGATAGRKLDRHTSFDLGYTYGRPFYETGGEAFSQRAESHTGRVGLTREISRRDALAVRYTYQLYLREGLPDDRSHVAGLGYTRSLGRGTTVNLFAGARFQAEQVRPDVSASLAQAWRRSALTLSYANARYYVPTTGGFTETDIANLSYNVGSRRFRLTLGVGYSRNRLEEGADAALGNEFESWRGGLDAVYRLSRWLGVGGAYQYLLQDSGDPRFGQRERHLGQVGFVLQPWSDPQRPEGLRR